MDQQAIEPPAATPASWLRASRHLVGFFFVVMLPTWFLYPWANAIRWAATPLAIVATAAITAGLLALFFTAGQAKNTTRNFVVVLWVLGLTWLAIATASSLQSRREAAQFDPSTATPVEPKPNPFSDPNFGKDLPKK